MDSWMRGEIMFHIACSINDNLSDFALFGQYKKRNTLDEDIQLRLPFNILVRMLQ